jgi:hypothetical protein
LSSSLFSVISIVTVVLLAGCADKSALKEVSATTTAPPPPESGAIAGTVTDEELLPIEKARVQIVGSDGATPIEEFTDEKGAFSAEGLTPGRYQLFVTHVAHRDAVPKFADVLAGEIVEVHFQLDVLRIQTPFVSILPYTFFYNLAWCFPEAVGQLNNGIYCQGLGWDTANITHQFLVDEPTNGILATLVHESRWTAATPVCQLGMQLDVYSPQQATLPANGDMSDPARGDGNPFHWTNPTVTSPTKIFAPRDGSEPDAMMSPKRTELNGGNPIVTDGKWSVLHWGTHADGPAGLPVPIGCTIEQRLDGYISLFYVAPAPGPEWSALPP